MKITERSKLTRITINRRLSYVRKIEQIIELKASFARKEASIEVFVDFDRLSVFEGRA